MLSIDLFYCGENYAVASSTHEDCEENTNENRGKKRKRRTDEWKKIQVKILHNSGKVEERKMNPACSEKCRLRSYKNFKRTEKSHSTNIGS